MDARTSVLHPDVHRRGLLGQPKTVWVPWLVVVVVGGLFYMAVQTTAAMLVFLVVLFGFVALTWQVEDVPSLGARGVVWSRDRRRLARGEHAFVSVADEDTAAEAGIPVDAGLWVRPVPLGAVKPLTLSGTVFEDMFVLQHSNPGETEYLSAVLAVEGLTGGLRAVNAYAPAQQAFGRVLAQLAKKSSLVRGLQVLHRSVPYDVRPHVFWLEDNLVDHASPELYSLSVSADQLISQVKQLTEEHRTFVVVRVPVTGRFMAAAKDRGEQAVGWASVMRDELERVASLLRGAGLGRVDVLGESRACAALRAFQDPSFPVGKHRGVTWGNCWQSYVGEHDWVVVNGSRFTAVARVTGIEPAELGPLWLSPLLTRVETDPAAVENGATIRTVSVRMDLVPAARARTRAKLDRTSDIASQITQAKKGTVSDGTTEVMRASSDARAQDLVPGSGHGGVVYSMMVAVTADSPDALRRAKSRVEDAASECAIPNLDWFTDWHDVAVFGTYLLGRGMAETRDAVRVGR